jgi:hypothetical protein
MTQKVKKGVRASAVWATISVATFVRLRPKTVSGCERGDAIRFQATFSKTFYASSACPSAATQLPGAASLQQRGWLCKFSTAFNFPRDHHLPVSLIMHPIFAECHLSGYSQPLKSRRPPAACTWPLGRAVPGKRARLTVICYFFRLGSTQITGVPAYESESALSPACRTQFVLAPETSRPHGHFIGGRIARA